MKKTVFMWTAVSIVILAILFVWLDHRSIVQSHRNESYCRNTMRFTHTQLESYLQDNPSHSTTEFIASEQCPLSGEDYIYAPNITFDHIANNESSSLFDKVILFAHSENYHHPHYSGSSYLNFSPKVTIMIMASDGTLVTRNVLSKYKIIYSYWLDHFKSGDNDFSTFQKFDECFPNLEFTYNEEAFKRRESLYQKLIKGQNN